MLQKERLEKIFERRFVDEGDNYRALCPVHKEKTPSFYIHKDDGLVHCFGCGAKGNVVRFTQEYKGVDEETAEILLGLTHEDVVDSWFMQDLPPRQDPRIYPESWLAPFKKEIHKYVIRRGLKESVLQRAGVLYDHSRERQVFPHRDRDGRLLGAIGRACKGKEPKWYFYWGYEKGKSLYVCPEEDIHMGQTVWITEGVFDALWCYQHGIHAVATLGSKPTRSQIQEIIDSYDRVVLAYDNDEAGHQGVRYLYEKLKNHVSCLVPLWPKEVNDVMELNPNDLRLYNLVEWEFIPISTSG